MGVKSDDFAQQGRVPLGRRRRHASQPAQKFGVGQIEQGFEFIEFGANERIDAGVDEAADQNIELAHAAPPGADADALATDFVFCRRIVRQRRGSHDARLSPAGLEREAGGIA